MSLVCEVVCDKCGEQLEFTIGLDKDDDLYISTQECEGCKKINYDEGYNEAEVEHHNKGYAKGHDDGYNEAMSETPEDETNGSEA